MNHDLTKFHHWLLSSTFKNKWFEEKIKLQIISLLSWLIYPDYRQQNSLLSIIRKNQFMMMVITVFLLWSTTFYTFGRLSSDVEKVVIKIEKEKKVSSNFEEIDFKNLKQERKFYEYIVFSNFKIENYDNLQKLPDEVFFTILSEINQHQLPSSVFFRLLDQESGFRDIINKNSGAKGIPQIMPCTRKSILNKIGYTNHRLIDDIRVSAYHLKIQYEVHKSNGHNERESWLRSLTDYNGGCVSLARENMKYFKMDMN